MPTRQQRSASYPASAANPGEAIRRGLAKTAKGQAKKDVYAHWLAWQQRPEQYPTDAAFALAMLDRHECLAAQKTVTIWCRAWRRGEDLPDT